LPTVTSYHAPQYGQLWNGDYIRYFMNCGMNCLALGRLGSDFEEREFTGQPSLTCWP
jgi:hypothetical protein